MHKGKGAGRPDWQTPPWLIEGVCQVLGGPIELDPATSSDNPTRAVRFYTSEQDGLRMPWSADSVFLNPPWSRKAGVDHRPWLKRAKDARDLHQLRGRLDMFVLVSAAMNAAWFHEYLGDMDMFFFPKGRVKYETPDIFEESADAPGFDSVLCYAGVRLLKFKQVFGHTGLVTMRVG
jgi:phage N-6-adenine-methyltransferase